jgi:hypothetical protein
MQLELGHSMLEARPFFRIQGDEFQAELLRTAPTDHGFLNL